MRTGLILLIMTTISLSSCGDGAKPPALYEGKDISGIAEITRDKCTKETTLTIKADGEWEIYTGVQVDLISHIKPLLTGKGNGIYSLHVPYAVRNYFQVVTSEGKAILAERQLPMEGGYNFRDLGGIQTADGRFVKWGKLFRSDGLNALTNHDLNYLASIPLISLVDFSSESEVETAPDRVPPSVKHTYSYPITLANHTGNGNMQTLAEADHPDSSMINIYRQLVTEPESVGRYKDFFALLQDEKQLPLMFHCSAGKDRTGMGAALILLALGVDEGRVMQDYLLSNIYLKDKYADFIELFPVLRPLFTVKYDFLQAGFEQIKESYGSIAYFLENILNVNIDKFKNMYLY